MANFQKHLEISTLVGGVTSTILLGAGFINTMEALILWIVATLGGILPDIDSDNSTTLKILFGIFSFFITLLCLSSAKPGSIIEVWLLVAIIHCVIHFIIRPIFEKFTVHRGVFHSLLGAVCLSLMGVLLATYFTNTSSRLAWLIGLFLFQGYVVHLILDEIYAVDFSNVSVKRSFGSALKLFDYGNVKVSMLMLVFTAGLYLLTPSPVALAQNINATHILSTIKQRFAPEEYQSIKAMFTKRVSR